MLDQIGLDLSIHLLKLCLVRILVIDEIFED